MKALLHLFYGFCLLMPILINACICIASYRWHVHFKQALERQLEEMRRPR